MILKDPDHGQQLFNYLMALLIIVAMCVVYFFFGDTK